MMTLSSCKRSGVRLSSLPPVSRFARRVHALRITGARASGMLVASVLLLCFPTIALGQFTDIGSASGTANTGTAGGVAWADYDNDGYTDLYVNGAGALYRNLGNSTFAAPISLAGTRQCIWADFDNDGDLDLKVWSALYRNNGNGTFSSDVDTILGITGPCNEEGQAWVDYDEDGLIDLFIPDGSCSNYMFRNQGNGTFASLGTNPIGITPNGNGDFMCVGDYSGDGSIDLLYRITTGNHPLWKSNGNGTFTESSSAAGVSFTAGNSLKAGLAFGDYDNDGDLDLYVCVYGNSNVLYRNDGDSTFTDVSVAAGIGGGTNSRGVVWGDYDNDGDLDVYVGNDGAANNLFRNNNNGTFTDVAASLSVADTSSTQGVAFADFDNDGDLDLYINNKNQANKLYRNDLNNARSLQVKVRGAGAGKSSLDGIGTRVRLYDSTNTTLLAVREVNGSRGMGSQDPLIVHFGVDPALTFTVRAKFISGTEVVRSGVVPQSESITIGSTTVSRTIEILEGAGVTIVESGGTTAVSENGPTSDTYTVVLKTLPTSTVTVTVDPDTQTDLSAGAGTPISLVFTTGNWSVSQTVTVTAVDDGLIEGAHTSTITHTSVSTDPSYNALSISNVSASITDDDTAGVTIVESGGITLVSEAGPSSDTYTVALTAQPTADVTVTVDPDTQSTVGAGAGNSVALTFTSANWSVAQTVTVTAIDDAVVEGAHSSTITHTTASADGSFNGLTVSNVVSGIDDNDDQSGGGGGGGGGGSFNGPVGNDLAVSTDEDTPVQIILSGTQLGTNPAYFVVISPQHGAVVGDPPELVYTAESDYSGADEFRFIIVNDAAGSAQATVSIDVQPVSDTPVAQGFSVSVEEDSTNNPMILSVTDADPEDNPTVIIVSLPTQGTLSVEGLLSGAGVDFACRSILLGPDDSSSRPISDRRTPFALDPIGSPPTILVGSDLPLALPTGIQTLLYSPDPDFVGTDRFAFKADDGKRVSAPATATITVTNTPEVLIAEDSDLAVPSLADGTMVTLPIEDPDPDLSIFIRVLPEHGALIDPQTGTVFTTAMLPARLSSGNTFRYVPDEGFTGDDSFDWFLEQGVNHSDDATVRLSAFAVPDPPQVTDLSADLDGTGDCVSLGIPLIDDPSSRSLVVVIDSLPLQGMLTDPDTGDGIGEGGLPAALTAGPFVIYTPEPGAAGLDTFTYFVRDDLMRSEVATVSLSIQPAGINPPMNDSPTDNPTTDDPQIGEPPASGPPTGCGPCGALGAISPLSMLCGLVLMRFVSREPRRRVNKRPPPARVAPVSNR